MNKLVLFVCVATLLALLHGPVQVEAYSKAQWLCAIRWKESSCLPEGRVPDGDGGKAIGPYQIWQVYWSDCNSGHSYQDMRKLAPSVKCIEGYMKRYCRGWGGSMDEATAERCARIHNGGPAGASNPNTLAYWNKAKTFLGACPASCPVPASSFAAAMTEAEEIEQQLMQAEAAIVDQIMNGPEAAPVSENADEVPAEQTEEAEENAEEVPAEETEETEEVEENAEEDDEDLESN